MALSAQHYYLQQTKEFMRAFNSPSEYPIALQHPKQLADVGCGYTWAWDPEVSAGKAFVRSPCGGPKEYWVYIDWKKGYREGFLSFLEKQVGLPRSAVDSSWHVDHILNSAFARRHGLPYVRVALLYGKFNTGYGRLMEKRFTRIKANSKSVYLLDFLVMMKLLHISPPKNKAEYIQRRKEIAKVFINNGINESENLVLISLDAFFELWEVL